MVQFGPSATPGVARWFGDTVIFLQYHQIWYILVKSEKKTVRYLVADSLWRLKICFVLCQIRNAPNEVETWGSFTILLTNLVYIKTNQFPRAWWINWNSDYMHRDYLAYFISYYLLLLINWLNFLISKAFCTKHNHIQTFLSDTQ